MYVSNINMTNASIPAINNKKACKNTSFGGYMQTLTHTNIGSCMDGYIGKVKVRKENCPEAFLNVFKKCGPGGEETYSIKTFADDLVGEISLRVKKFYEYDKEAFHEDPSHVFVTDLKNYSNPFTPYYKKGMEHYKDVGLRLMQIAQRRSDEALCNGNIRLVTNNESKDWYKFLIGMTEEFPHSPSTMYYGKSLNVHNPNTLILPAQAKERLAWLRGGL